MPAPSSLRGTILSTTSEVSPPEEYFRGVSTLCRRMLDDMSAVKESFGENWDQLSYNQQCRVIDQSIVDEATVRRYESGGASGPECEYFPKLKLPTGQKVVRDENLTARGFSCSWRDEHSAPFSWHTRSQMDLTLDTPPDTPTHPSTPIDPLSTTVEGEGRVIPGGRAVYTARPVSLPRPPRFRWHYDPPDAPPDPPSIVVAAPRSSTLPTELKQGPKRSPSATKYMLVRGKGEENEGGGLLAKIRGAVAALTATCLPLRATPETTSHLSVHMAPEGGGEPELRPPHVQAQAAKYSSGQTWIGTPEIQSNTSPSGHYSSCQAPLSSISADPTLSGYMCSLPDDDDDLPYSAVSTSIPAPHNLSPHGQLPPTFHTSTINMTQASETPTTQTTMANHASPISQSDISNVGFAPSNYMSPTASLPTPVPTPTAGNPNNTLKTFSPMYSSTPTAPSPSFVQQHNAFRPILQQPDLITDTLDSSRADVNNTTDTDKELLIEKEKSDADENKDELSTTKSSEQDEAIIPKTGFDFLDDW